MKQDYQNKQLTSDDETTKVIETPVVKTAEEAVSKDKEYFFPTEQFSVTAKSHDKALEALEDYKKNKDK